MSTNSRQELSDLLDKQHARKIELQRQRGDCDPMDAEELRRVDADLRQCEADISQLRTALARAVAVLAMVCGGWAAGCLVTIPDIELPTVPATTSTTMPPAATPAAAVDLSGEIIDPPGFTEESVAANSRFEECHMDKATGVFRLRCSVIRGKSGGHWLLSSPFVLHFKKGAGGSIIYDQDFEYLGGIYHCRGFASDEPRTDNPALVATGHVWKPGMPTWPVWEVRAAKQ